MLATVVWLAWVLEPSTNQGRWRTARFGLAFNAVGLIWALTLRGLARWWLGATLLQLFWPGWPPVCGRICKPPPWPVPPPTTRWWAIFGSPGAPGPGQLLAKAARCLSITPPPGA